MAAGGKQPGAGGQSPGDIQWAKAAAVVGVAASLVALLAFFGIDNFTQLKRALSATASPSATAPYGVNQPSGSDTTASSSPASTTSSPTTTYTPIVPSTPAFDPAWLDNPQTDPTPFTEAALLPSGFTDSQGIHFSLVTGGEHACIHAFMSSNVQYALNSSGCTAAMTGDYLSDSGVVTATNEVLVSVQVFPLGSASTALQVYNSLNASGSWAFGIWCPVTGLGANACGSGFTSAFKWHYIRTDHRYLIEATALYTDLTQNPAIGPWIESAAVQADDMSGPENYAGNH